MKMGSKRGGTILIVLGCLMLFTGLVIFLLSTISAERRRVQNRVALEQCRQWKSVDATYVESQIRLATTQDGKAWCTMPGLIRTYAADVQPAVAFKLYSASNAQIAGELNYKAIAEEDAPAKWADSLEEWTDINSPSVTSGQFPIIDPEALGKIEGFSIDEERSTEMPVRWLYLLQDGSLVVPQ